MKKVKIVLLAAALITCTEAHAAGFGLYEMSARAMMSGGHNVGKGIDASAVAHEEAEEKSVSREHTFLEDETDRETVRGRLLELVEDVGRRFRKERRWARTAKIKLRDGMFNTLTRQAAFPRPARDDISFRHAMLELFDREWPPGTRRVVRLAGFGVTNFTDEPEEVQADLFGASPIDEQMRKRERLAEALDAIRQQPNR